MESKSYVMDFGRVLQAIGPYFGKPDSVEYEAMIAGALDYFNIIDSAADMAERNQGIALDLYSEGIRKALGRMAFKPLDDAFSAWAETVVHTRTEHEPHCPQHRKSMALGTWMNGYVAGRLSSDTSNVFQVLAGHLETMNRIRAVARQHEDDGGSLSVESANHVVHAELAKEVNVDPDVLYSFAGVISTFYAYQMDLLEEADRDAPEMIEHALTESAALCGFLVGMNYDRNIAMIEAGA